MPRGPIQPSLFPRSARSVFPSLEHGGDTRESLRKIRRPLDPARSTHVVLRSGRARGEWSFLHRKNRARIERLIYAQAERASVKVYRHANVGNHLHLLVKAPHRKAFQNYLRALAGLIPRLVTGTRKGHALPLRCEAGSGNRLIGEDRPLRGLGARVDRKFWDAPAYTRVVGWGREYEALKAYIGKNRLEACGFRGARLRFSSKGEAVVVVGAPDLRLHELEGLTVPLG